VQTLFELVAATMLVALMTAGLAVAGVALWLRARRRRARARLERVLDDLAGEVTLRLAAGRTPGWALTRYRRLTDDARTTRTWSGLQRLILRERVLDGVHGAGRALADPATRARAARWMDDRTVRLRAAVPATRRRGR
jgi:Flp pilus assembly protein TadB